MSAGFVTNRVTKECKREKKNGEKQKRDAEDEM
jgi:hypothetical protein